MKTLPPATGTVKWVGNAANGNRLLEIVPVNTNGKAGEANTYEVAPVSGGYDLHNLTSAITKGEFTCYHVRYWANGKYVCDCPDATNRPERRCECKHVRGLLAALKSSPF